MPLRLKDKKVRVIDRTLPEIISQEKAFKRLEIIYFCWLLKNIGVDVIEIDNYILRLIGKLPIGLEFIYRIRNMEDLELCLKNKVRECIVSMDVLDNREIIGILCNNNMKIIVEYSIGKYSDINNLKHLDSLKKNINNKSISEIRITGIKKSCTKGWMTKIKDIENTMGVTINLCPLNTYSCATAICLEAIMEGVSSITVTFSGYGKASGYGALEEVFMATKIIIKNDMRTNLGCLPEMAKYFEKITDIRIPDNKAVIGKGIFDYQAGIHADGIEKNPITYEPYDPELVGLKRNLTVGKHSGKRAVQKKLKELGIKCKMEEAEEMLPYIRERSISFKRDLLDQEVIDIYSKLLISHKSGWTKGKSMYDESIASHNIFA